MSQAAKLYALLSDGKPHRTDEIVAKVYGPGLSLARVGARIYDVQKKYGVKIEGWHDRQNQKLYWYRMRIAAPAPIKLPEPFKPTVPRPQTLFG